MQAPAGSAAEAGNAPVEAASKAAPKAVAAADDDLPFDADDAPAAAAPVQTANKPAQKAEDILAMIRARQTKQ